MTIDFTKPVETTEDPPRPVRVLATNLNNACAPIAVSIWNPDGMEWVTQVDKTSGSVMTGHDRPTLRNVAPPKPEPVLREAWLNLYEDRAGSPYSSEKEAHTPRNGSRVECRRIAWMSDGSPVPASPEQFDQMREMAKLIQDLDEWKAQCEQWAALLTAWAIEKDAWVDSLGEARQQRDDASVAVEEWKSKAEEALSLLQTANDRVEALQSEVDDWKRKATERGDMLYRQAPVVDAAVIWERRFSQLASDSLVAAVRAYQYQPKKSAAEAVANVVAMMGPVQNCTTCRNSYTYHADAPCNVCADNSRRKPFKSQWEAKSHD